MAPVVAMQRSVLATRPASWLGCFERSWATAPATCGAAIDVPLNKALLVSLEAVAPRMPDPGACRSTQAPWFEKEDFASADVVEPTVIASAADAGDLVQASLFSFPAAATTTTLASCAALTARFIAEERPPPSDMEMIARLSG